MRKFLTSGLVVLALGGFAGLVQHRLGAMILTNAVAPGCTSNALQFVHSSNSIASTPTLAYGGGTGLSVSYWFNAPSFDTLDGILMESSTNSNHNTGTFLSDPNSSAPDSGGWDISASSSAASGVTEYSRPSTGAWHHIVTIYNYTNILSTSVSSPTVLQYRDNVLQTALAQHAGDFNNSLTDQPLFLGARSGPTLTINGSISRLALWAGSNILSASDVTALFGGANPTTIGASTVGSTAKYYWTVDSTSAMSNLGSGGTAPLTPVNTSVVAGPAVCFS